MKVKFPFHNMCAIESPDQTRPMVVAVGLISLVNGSLGRSRFCGWICLQRQRGFDYDDNFADDER